MLCSMMLTSITCYAAIPANQVVLGGIERGASVQSVEDTYGKPDKVEKKMGSAGEKVEYKYGDSLEVDFFNGKVHEVEISHNSEVKTAAGIGLGATAADVEAAYGTPDLVKEDKYVYFVEGDRSQGLKFKFKLGKVAKIECDFGN